MESRLYPPLRSFNIAGSIQDAFQGVKCREVKSAAKQSGKANLISSYDRFLQSQGLNPVKKTDELFRHNYGFFTIKKVRLQVRVEMKTIRHSNDIGIVIFQSRDYIPDIEKRPNNAIVSQKQCPVRIILWVFL